MHLNDKTVHSIVDNLDNLVPDIIIVITNKTISFKDEIGMTKKMREWVILCVNLKQPDNMYLNPKAYKSPLYPGRMITTGCGSYVETAYELKKAN